jgi:hypothetical protein
MVLPNSDTAGARSSTQQNLRFSGVFLVPDPKHFRPTLPKRFTPAEPRGRGTVRFSRSSKALNVEPGLQLRSTKRTAR